MADDNLALFLADNLPITEVMDYPVQMSVARPQHICQLCQLGRLNLFRHLLALFHR
ncbi:hypothetical protein D3C76_1832280 [compost metagenome]